MSYKASAPWTANDWAYAGLLDENRRLRAALKLYASNQTWDRGEAAREALGERLMGDDGTQQAPASFMANRRQP